MARLARLSVGGYPHLVLQRSGPRPLVVDDDDAERLIGGAPRGRERRARRRSWLCADCRTRSGCWRPLRTRVPLAGRCRRSVAATFARTTIATPSAAPCSMGATAPRFSNRSAPCSPALQFVETAAGARGTGGGARGLSLVELSAPCGSAPRIRHCGITRSTGRWAIRHLNGRSPIAPPSMRVLRPAEVARFDRRWPAAGWSALTPSFA